jgi:hypothetical protein
MRKPPKGKDEFRQEVEAFLAVHPEISVARFGLLAAKDRAFVPDLREGRTPRPGKMLMVRRWMATYVAVVQARQRQMKPQRRLLAALVREMAASGGLPSGLGTAPSGVRNGAAP